MKKMIRILGACTDRCTQLFDLADQAALELGLDYEIETVGDIKRMSEYGRVASPALVIDGKIMTSGTVPRVEEIKRLLQD